MWLEMFIYAIAQAILPYIDSDYDIKATFFHPCTVKSNSAKAVRSYTSFARLCDSKKTQNMPNKQLHRRSNVKITIKDKDIYLFYFGRKPAFNRIEWTQMNFYSYNLSATAQFDSILFFHENLQTYPRTYVHVGGARAHQIDSECIP